MGKVNGHKTFWCMPDWCRINPSYATVLLCMYLHGFVLHMQTLLKTTHHIMVHDVRGSLAKLRSLVQKAISPHSNTCVICSRGAEFLADGSRDDVVVFR